ncbi:hypothetical protein K7432_012434 [Basidiobolus ranarum]|uniref:Uncharacterized protein n=1 Tax=Basidiobolus ranarum TaxID=34480 RepID=A0ABR2VST6_9FUNG
MLFKQFLSTVLVLSSPILIKAQSSSAVGENTDITSTVWVTVTATEETSTPLIETLTPTSISEPTDVDSTVVVTETATPTLSDEGTQSSVCSIPPINSTPTETYDSTVTVTVTSTNSNSLTEVMPTSSTDSTIITTASNEHSSTSGHTSAASTNATSTKQTTSTALPTPQSDDCEANHYRCNGDDFDQCVFGKWLKRQCATGTKCHNSEGSYIACY